MDELERVGNGPAAMIPASFAEKAMGSLMQLHTQLMEEKERRVDLHRRLMEKEQALAELRMYVKLLEEKSGVNVASPSTPAPRPAPTPVASVAPAPAGPVVQVADSPKVAARPVTPLPPKMTPPRREPVRAAAGSARATFGWRSW